MDKVELNKLLQQVADGEVSPDEAALQLKMEPIKEVGEYAKVDMHRGIRQGVPEVIYGAGKTQEHILGIAKTMLQNGQKTVLVTRISKETADFVREGLSGIAPLDYNELSRTGVIGVLATAGTLKGSKYLATKGNFEDNCTIVEHVGRGFVELVERGALTGPEAEATVRESLEPLLEAGADTVVLGCTHYPFLLETLQKVAGPGIRFIDPAPAVARHLIYVMVQERLLSEGEATRALAKVIELAEAEAMGKQRTAPARVPDVRLISSGDPLPLQRMFRLLYPAVQKTENK